MRMRMIRFRVSITEAARAEALQACRPNEGTPRSLLSKLLSLKQVLKNEGK